MANALSAHSMFTCIHKHYGIDRWQDFVASSDEKVFNHMAVSLGTSDADFKMLTSVMNLTPNFKFICLDVANGYSEHFLNTVRRVRKTFPDKTRKRGTSRCESYLVLTMLDTVIAGNVVTGEMVEELLLNGADIVKIGIGPGSVCTTRVKTVSNLLTRCINLLQLLVSLGSWLSSAFRCY